MLDPLATGGAWYGVNMTEPPVYPYIVYLRIVSPTNNSFDGQSDVQNTVFQIDCFSQRISEAQAVEKAVETALSTAMFTAIQQDQRDGYESAVKAYRCSTDYSCWSAN